MGKGGESWVERSEGRRLVRNHENMTCQYEKGPVSLKIRPFRSTIRSTCTSDGGRRWPPSSRPPQPHPGTYPQTFGILELDAIVDGISGPLGGVVRAELVVARVGHVSGAGPYGVLQTLPTDTDDGGTGLEEPFRFLLLFQKMTCCEIDILLVVSARLCWRVFGAFS